MEVHMVVPSSFTVQNGSEDVEIWASLKESIANSSGFAVWKQQQDNTFLETRSLDMLVRCYLRETLVTLAY